MHRNLLLAWILTGSAALAAPQAPATGTSPALAVREVVVFKDGHALVRSEGPCRTDADGHVVIDELPTPIMGTFWPYVASAGVRLTGVAAGQRRMVVGRTALSVMELVQANPGADVMITEKDGTRYSAKLLGVPARAPAERDVLEPEGRGRHLAESGDLVMARTADGVKALPLSRIQDVTFRGDFASGYEKETLRDVLTYRLDHGERRRESVDVGMSWVEKGFRWIPAYRIEIDGEGKARLELHATLVNDLCDIEGARVHLVIGVPRFEFADLHDPIALEQQVQAFVQNAFDNGTSNFNNAFSNNRITTQIATNYSPPGAGGAASGGSDVGVSTADRNEDLFVFRLDDMTLRRGERLVVPIASVELPYEDIHVLELPWAPPPEARVAVRADDAIALANPKAMHNIRLENLGPYPLTTAPALIIREGRVVAQGMMRYTPVGAKVDVTLTATVDIAVIREERESGREPDAARFGGNSFHRVDLAGEISVCNHTPRRVRLEIVRSLLGHVSHVGEGGTSEMVQPYDESYRSRWDLYRLSSSWNVNGVGRLRFEKLLEPGASATCEYGWYYYWR